MMSNKIALVFAASLLFAVACDSTEAPNEDRAGAAVDDNPDHGERHNPAEKLCSELDCTEAQAAKIDELFASRRAAKHPGARDAHKAARADANKLIADAFRADSFDAKLLERAHPKHDAGEHQAKMVEFATQLHAILTPEQRVKLADKLEAKGPMMLGHHGDKPKRDPAERLAHKLDRFCEAVACTAEQKTQLSASFSGLHADKPSFKPLADAFKAETLDPATLRAAILDRKAKHGDEFGAVIAEVHDILTPEQRAIVAETIEVKGLHAVLGKGKHHKGERAAD